MTLYPAIEEMGDLNKDVKATRLKRRHSLLFNWDNVAPVLNYGAKKVTSLNVVVANRTVLHPPQR